MASVITIPEALKSVGYLGRFQIIFFVMFVGSSCLNGSITFQFQALSIMPDVICLSEKCQALKDNEGDDTLICNLKVDEWKFDNTHHNWLTEFELYCDNTYLKGMGTTVYFVGFMVGVSLLSSLCDKFGRRKTNISLLLGYLLALICLHNSTTLSMVYFCRFFLGFFHSGISVCVFTAFNEFTLPNIGIFANVSSGAAFTVGGSVSSFLAYHNQYWQDSLQPLIFIQCVSLLIYFVLCPETPFWLLARNRNSDAIESLNFVAKINGNPPLPKDFTLPKCNEEKESENPFRIIISNLTLRDAVMKLSFAWFTVSTCYYALQFNAGSLGDDEYSVMVWMGLVDVPARLSIVYFASKYGRKCSTRWYFAVCAVALGLCLVPSVSEIYLGTMTLKSIFVMIGHGCGGGIFSLLYTYTSEVLPTLARSTGVSMCSTVARIASILSPFVIILNQISGSLIYFIAFACILTSMSLMKSIPETLNKQLPNSVAECEVLFHGKQKVESV